MKFGILGFLLFLFPFASMGQSVPQLEKAMNLNERVELWRQYSNELLEAGKYKEMYAAAQKGLAMLPDDSLRKRAMFSLFAAVALSGMDQERDAEKYYQQTIHLGEQVSALKYVMTAMAQLDGIYSNRRDHKSRLANIQKMQAIAQTERSEDFKQLAFSALAAYYSDLGNYDLSIQYRLDLVASYKRAFEKDPSEQSYFFNAGLQLDNVGNFFNTTGRSQKALDYLYEAEPYFEKIVDVDKKARHYVYFMQAFRELDQLDSQKVYYNKIKRLHLQNPVSNEWALANFSLAGYFADRDKADEALRFGLLAKEIAVESNSSTTKVQIAQVLGHAYYLKMQYRLAIQEYNYALSYDLEMDKENALYIRKGLSNAYAALQLWDSAYAQLHLYTSLSDNLNIEVTDKNFAEVEGQYQNKLKQEQIKSQATALSFAKKQFWWLFAGLVLLGILTLLLFIIYRNKRKAATALDRSNQKLNELNVSLNEANHTKAKLFGILSHDLRTPISHVYQYLNLLETNPDALSEEQKTMLSTKTKTATAALLNNMEDILLWSKSQLENFQVEMGRVALKPLLTNVLHLHALQIETKALAIDLKLNTEEVESDANFLHTIIRNLIQNAISASLNKALINIYLIKADKNLVLVIENQGAIFSQQDFETIVKGASKSGKNGLGLQLVNDLAQKIDVDIKFENPNNETTHTLLRFKEAIKS